MKRNYCLSLVLLALFGMSAPFAANAANESVLSSQSTKKNRNKFISTIHTKSNYNSTFQQPYPPASFPYRLYSPSHLFGYFQKHIVQFAGMNTFLILGILLIGILLGLVKGDARHLVLRLSHHRRIQLFVRKEIIQIHITNHGRFKEIHVFMTGIRVVSYKHMPRGAHQYRFYVDGTEQRSKKHTSIHTVDLRGLQGVIERAHTL